MRKILARRAIVAFLLGPVLLVSVSIRSTTSEASTKAAKSTATTMLVSNVDSASSQWPMYDPSPRVDPGNDTNNVTYNGGPVIDDTANLYVIFWEDPSYEQATPDYINLVTQFFNDVGNSPLYANLFQYTDSMGSAPTGARLAGTFTDTRAFPSDLMSLINDPNQPDAGYYWHQEIMSVATEQGWYYQNPHNYFFVFPIANLGCGSHGFLGDRPEETNISNGSPTAVVYYPYANGQEQCVVSPYSPNNDHLADIAIGIASHELMEGVADPHPGTGWGEIADRCFLPPDTIDPTTQANVVWNGHPYLLQEEWDNFRNGCVLEGP